MGGVGGSFYIRKVTESGTIRILMGGLSGTATAGVLEHGEGYSFIVSALNGSMGLMGYYFIGSVCIMLFVWLANFYESRWTLIK